METAALRLRYGEAAARLKASKSVLIVCLPEDDADAVASCLQIDEYLTNIKKRHLLYCAHPLDAANPLYRHLPVHKFTTRLPKKPTCIVIVDYGKFSRVGLSAKYCKNASFVAFDHHDQSTDDLAKDTVPIIDLDAPSTTAIIYRFLNYCGIPLSDCIATYTKIGMYADTRGHTEHFSGQTFQTLSECSGHGVTWEDISSGDLTINALQLAHRFFEHYSKELGLVWLVLEKDEVVSLQDVYDALNALDLVCRLRGVRVAALVTPPVNKIWKISIRSRDSKISAAHLARVLGTFGTGGDGREQAAAARWTDMSPTDILQILYGEIEKLSS